MKPMSDEEYNNLTQIQELCIFGIIATGVGYITIMYFLIRGLQQCK